MGEKKRSEGRKKGKGPRDKSCIEAESAEGGSEAKVEKTGPDTTSTLESSLSMSASNWTQLGSVTLTLSLALIRRMGLRPFQKDPCTNKQFVSCKGGALLARISTLLQ